MASRHGELVFETADLVRDALLRLKLTDTAGFMRRAVIRATGGTDLVRGRIHPGVIASLLACVCLTTTARAGVTPMVGARIRLQARSSGKWESSSGAQAQRCMDRVVVAMNQVVKRTRMTSVFGVHSFEHRGCPHVNACVSVAGR